MREFDMVLNSLQQVQRFVSLAMIQPFEIMVGNDHQLINGKSFMGLFSLNCQEPLQVTVRCYEEEFLRFRQDASRFLV